MCRRLVAFDRLTITLGWDIWTFFPPKWWDLTSWTLKMGRKKSRTNCNFSKLLLQFIRVYFVPPLPNNLPLGSRAWWERKLNISTILILCQWHEQCCLFWGHSKWYELLKIESFDTSDVASSFAQWNSSETANCTIYWTRILTWNKRLFLLLERMTKSIGLIFPKYSYVRPLFVTSGILHRTTSIISEDTVLFFLQS